MHHQTHQEQHQEQKEQDLGNSRECDSHATEPHDGRYQCDQKEHQRVIKHWRILLPSALSAYQLPSLESISNQLDAPFKSSRQ
jgi:hypothetical protein